MTFKIVLLAGFLGLAGAVSALPEDRQQPIDIDATSSEGTLNADVTFRGTETTPARVTQGSMQISGIEIHVTRQNGEVQSITATGNPARFQQQPAADQEIVHVSGQRMTLDNVGQTVAVDGNVTYRQGDNSITASHIDYNMQSGLANATAEPGGTVQMILQPARPAEPATP